jgi:ParB-like chromosome segregation protein Spo0J
MTETTRETRPPDLTNLTDHPIASIFPLIEGDEFDGLVLSIEKHGLFEPIVLHEGKILDGRNRYRACREAGFKLSPANFTTFNGPDPKAFVINTNAHRRHLSSAQKQDLIKRLLKDSPSASDRQIAKQAGVNHRTVAAVRDKLRPKGDVQLEEFKAKWEALSEAQRRLFVSAFSTDLRDLFR